MSSGFRNASGVDFDNLFDPYVQGTKPAATGLRTSDGTDLNQRYAPLSYGTKASATGFRLSNGADVNTLWAAKGTATYALAIDGGIYAADTQSRGNASVTLTLKANGTYAVTKHSSSLGSGSSTLATGTWLPSGDSASNWSVVITWVVTSNNTIQGGTNSTTTNASSQSALTSDRYVTSESDAILTGEDANRSVYVTVKLYRAGALRSTTRITMQTNANGN